MAHGMPDWFGTGEKTTTYGLSDDAELAVRLGSIVNFDRRGEVLAMTAFESGESDFSVLGNDLNCGSYWYMAGGLYRPTYLHIYKTGDSEGYVSVFHKGFIPPQTKLGIEAGVRNFAGSYKISLRYEESGFNLLRVWEIFFYPFGAGLYYLDANGGETQFAEMANDWFYGDGWNVMKMVVDTDTSSYVRFIFNHRTFVLSSPSCYQHGVSGNGSALQYVRVYNRPSAPSQCDVSHVILTGNEPV